QQYRLTKPWLTFPVNMTGGSSIMPQKLNPTGINAARELASGVIGHGVSYMFGAHKASAGDTDLMFAGPNEALSDTGTLMNEIGEIFSVLQFDEERALEEVLADYATATELANAMQLLGGVPFRDAHHIAAALVQFGRDNGLRATEISFEQFEEIYAEVAAEHDLPKLASAFTEAELARVLNPKNMVTSSQGHGGPQPNEVAAMIEAIDQTIAADQAWLAEQREKLVAADAALDAAFAKL
ncbi:MAG: hypothetical protein WBA73_07190, partial [Devosia sp.]